jgi:hypothetical protein
MTISIRRSANYDGTSSIRSRGTGGGIRSKLSPASVISSPIVSSGLILHLDAGNPASYPGSGTTWTDLSGNGKHATLFNSPTYSSSNGGLLVFSKGSSQYAQGSALGSQSAWTISLWMRVDAALDTYATPFSDIYGASGRVAYCFYGNSGGNGNLGGALYEGGSWSVTSPPWPATLGDWHHHVASWDGTTVRHYVDTSLYGTVNRPHSGISDGVGYRVARRWDEPTYISAAIPIVAFYNRKLTDAEILQNFNANKGRFGL